MLQYFHVLATHGEGENGHHECVLRIQCRCWRELPVPEDNTTDSAKEDERGQWYDNLRTEPHDHLICTSRPAPPYASACKIVYPTQYDCDRKPDDSGDDQSTKHRSADP